MSLVPIAVSQKVFKSALLLKQNSPKIMFVGGVAGAITSTVLACRATLKLSEALPDMRDNIRSVDGIENETERKRATTMVYAVNAGTVAKLYAPAVIVGTLSIGALTGAHVVLTRRNTALTAGFAALSKAYDEYRAHVREELGIDKEIDIYRGTKTEAIELEDGQKKEITTANLSGMSPYARLFDEGSRNFEKHPELNRMFIHCQQQWAQDQLMVKGYLFLNEVYKELGLEPSQAGQFVGWVAGKDGKDNYVDFGMFEATNRDFINGVEPRIWLDFNVDGPIYKYLP